MGLLTPRLPRSKQTCSWLQHSLCRCLSAAMPPAPPPRGPQPSWQQDPSQEHVAPEGGRGHSTPGAVSDTSGASRGAGDGTRAEQGQERRCLKESCSCLPAAAPLTSSHPARPGPPSAPATLSLPVLLLFLFTSSQCLKKFTKPSSSKSTTWKHQGKKKTKPKTKHKKTQQNKTKN